MYADYNALHIHPNIDILTSLPIIPQVHLLTSLSITPKLLLITTPSTHHSTVLLLTLWRMFYFICLTQSLFSDTSSQILYGSGNLKIQTGFGPFVFLSSKVQLPVALSWTRYSVDNWSAHQCLPARDLDLMNVVLDDKVGHGVLQTQWHLVFS